MADAEVVKSNDGMGDSQSEVPAMNIDEKAEEGLRSVRFGNQQKDKEPSADEVESDSQRAADAAEKISAPSEVDGVNRISSMEFEQFSKTEHSAAPQNISLLLDVTMPISIELGRTSMPIRDILRLGPGSVVELNKLTGEPVDLLVNDKLIAKGEVVVIDENFGIRITGMVSREDRIKSLG